MSDHLHALPAGHRLGEYRIERVLGFGGFGITYYALDTRHNKPVAIKEYLPNEFALDIRFNDSITITSPIYASNGPYTQGSCEWGLDIFRNEALVLARFEHPHINRMLHFFEDNGTAYIVLDYIEGETLSQVLKQDRCLDAPHLRRLLDELLSGLDEVHGANYVHRDIKPANIMLRPDGSAVLLDFGAARQTAGQHLRSIPMLTPGYAPIEQYDQNTEDVGPWSDFYALGMVAYRCITGIGSRKIPDALERMRLERKGGNSLVPAVEAGKGRYDESLLQAVDWAIRVDKDQRPRSVAALREVLADGSPEEAGDAPPPSTKVAAPPAHQPPEDDPTKEKSRLAGPIPVILLLVVGTAMVAAVANYVSFSQEQAGARFRDCKGCPEMVIVPAGSFTMGSPNEREDFLGPQHRVTVGKFAVGRYEITVSEFARFFSATGHSMENSCQTDDNSSWEELTGHNWRDPDFSQGETDPVVCVNWEDAKEYVGWLSRETGKRYRLLSESEWEYAARAGTTTPYYTGQTISSSQANYDNSKTVAVGSYPANKFGLHDMHGNVSEWVEDCEHDDYEGAPSDGSVWTTDHDCVVHIFRDGSWAGDQDSLRPVYRYGYPRWLRDNYIGFRVARTLTP